MKWTFARELIVPFLKAMHQIASVLNVIHDKRKCVQILSCLMQDRFCLMSCLMPCIIMMVVLESYNSFVWNRRLSVSGALNCFVL